MSYHGRRLLSAVTQDVVAKLTLIEADMDEHLPCTFVKLARMGQSDESTHTRPIPTFEIVAGWQQRRTAC